MKICRIIFVLSFSILFSCENNKTIKGKIDDNEYCYKVSNNDTICLDVHKGIDSLKVNKMISDPNRDVLLIFTGLQISAKALLSEENLGNYDIVNNLKKYSIIIMYVDDKNKLNANDSISIGEKNVRYQRNRFNTTAQPQYIIFLKGEQKCVAYHMGEEGEIISFLRECKQNRNE